MTPSQPQPSPSSPLRCYGYRPGMRSPCRLISLDIPPVAAAINRPWLEALDGTLAAAFGTAAPFPADRFPGDPGDAAVAVAARVLWLGGILVEAVGLPVFEPPRVVNVRRKPRGLEVQALASMLDGIPERITQRAFEAARQVVLALADGPHDLAAARRECERIHESLVRSLDQRAKVGLSTVNMLRVAFERDIPFRHLQEHVYQIGMGCHARLLNGAASDAESTLGSLLSHNKRSAAALLHRAGLPAADHVAVASPDEALAAAARLGWPVVVKPVDRDRGEGVVVGIRTTDALLAAFQAARQLSAGVLVERHVPGVCHRLLVIDGSLQFVTRRLPKGVWGDGRQSVAELVAAANLSEQQKPPWRRLKPFPLDDLAVAALAEVGLSPESVPPAGLFAPLREIQSMAQGGVSEDFTSRVHPENAALACQAARLFRLDVAGIDMISTDITRSWRETGAIVNEVNFAPLLGEIEQARTASQVLISHLVKGDGRIPIEVFVGDEAAFAAARKRLEQAPAGHVLASHDVTLTAPAGERPLAAHGLFAGCLALLTDRTVTGLLAVVQTDEWLTTGLPVDRINSLSVYGNHIRAAGGESAVGQARLRHLLETLQAVTLRPTS